jgi:hypothetical protein
MFIMKTKRNICTRWKKNTHYMNVREYSMFRQDCLLLALSYILLCLELERRNTELVKYWSTEVFLSPATLGSSPCHLPFACFLLGFYYPEHGGKIFLRNVDWIPTNYTLLYSRRYSLHNLRCGGPKFLHCYLMINYKNCFYIGSAEK